MPFLDNPATKLTPGQALLDAPMPALIQALGLAIAQAQTELDRNSIRTATTLGTTLVDFKDSGGNVTQKSLLELGFTPVFYHFTESTLEVSLSLTLRVEESFGLDVEVSIGNLQSPGKAATGSVEVQDNAALQDGNTVTIQATVIKFGIGTGEIPRGDDAKTTAEKLAGAINQADALKELVTASASGPKVTITAKKAGKDGNSAIQTSNATALKTTAMTGGEDSVVSEAADAVSGDGKQKQLIPFGAAINANYHRKYGFDMSGASKITSTLVSLPGPVEFLDEIKAFYSK